MEESDATAPAGTAGTSRVGRAHAGVSPFGRVGVVAGIGLYAVAAATARPLTDPATVAVLLPGLALFAYGVRRTPRRIVRATRATAATWVAFGLAFCVWELVAFAWGNDTAHPTLSLLADPVLDTYPGRLAGYLLWLGAGAWLVSR